MKKLVSFGLLYLTACGEKSIDSGTNAGITECTLSNCTLELGGGQSMDLVLISSGEDPKERYSIMSDFYLMTTEVTQGMFAEIMGYESYTGQPTSNDSGSYAFGTDYPAFYVTWHMAADFANKVTQHHNTLYGTYLEECYSCSDSGSNDVICMAVVNPYQCSGYVLPTESEWEYASRSGTTRDFWTGTGDQLGGSSENDCNGTEVITDSSMNTSLLADYSWYCGNNDNQYGAKEVGQKLPNGFGLYDMHGNVAEWTADAWGGDHPQSVRDPYNGNDLGARVIRGGRFASRPDRMMVSFRNGVDSTSAAQTYLFGQGFRLGLHP